MEAMSVLFICIGNSCRSPMAEAMARSMGGDRIAAYSAGLTPTGRIAANTLITLERLGYPTEGLASKELDSVPLDELDVVVSLIGDDGLRFLPHGISARLEAWPIRDPYGDDDEVYLAVARSIELRVRRLVDQLLEGELLGP